MADKYFKIREGIDLDQNDIININNFNGDSATVNIADISDGIQNIENVATPSELERLKKNNILNAFRLASMNTKTVYKMVNQIVDEYFDEAGIDHLDEPHIHFKLNDNTGNTTVVDSGLLGINGTATANTSTLTTTGKVNQALEFDGAVGGTRVNFDSAVTEIQSDNKGTISFWVKPNSFTNYGALFIMGHNSTDAGVQCYTDVSTGKIGFEIQDFDGGATAILRFLTEEAISLGVWTHIVISQDATSIKIYFNGVEKSRIIDIGTGAEWFDDLTPALNLMSIGGENVVFTGIRSLHGSMDDFRYYKNRALTSVEVEKIYNEGSGTEDTEMGISTGTEYDYENNWITNKDADSYMKLLVHFNGNNGDITTQDFSTPAHTINFNGNAEISTAESKFGGSSLSLDGTNSYLDIADSSDWDILATTGENWTIDFWLKLDTIASFNAIITQFLDGNNEWGIRHTTTFGLQFFLTSGGSTIINIFHNTQTILDNNWHHIALIRSGNDVGLYYDGNQVAYGLLGSLGSVNAPLYIGQRGNGTGYIDGYIDELHIHKSNFLNASPNVSLTDDILPLDTEEFNNAQLMEVISEKMDVSTEPIIGRLILIEEDMTDIILNTDLKGYISKDNGTSWNQVTLVEDGQYDSTRRILSSQADLTETGFGSGTEIKYKIEVAENRRAILHATSLSVD